MWSSDSDLEMLDMLSDWSDLSSDEDSADTIRQFDKTDEVTDEVSMYCVEEDAHSQSKGCETLFDSLRCSVCDGAITEFRYTCVQCSDFDLCGACEINRVHHQHYVLRVPAPRPFAEVQFVLATIRRHLMKKLDPIKEPDDDGAVRIKSEIKAEFENDDYDNNGDVEDNGDDEDNVDSHNSDVENDDDDENYDDDESNGDSENNDDEENSDDNDAHNEHDPKSRTRDETSNRSEKSSLAENKDLIINMPRKRSCPALGTRKYGKKSRYTEETLLRALDDIKNCKISQRKASQIHNIPWSTIKYKLKGMHSRAVGKPPVLSEDEEKSIVSHVVALSDLGIPIGMRDVRAIVKIYLDDNKRQIKEFKNNLPGWEWGKLFLERHSCIKQKVAYNINIKRAQVTQEMIDIFYNNLSIELVNVPASNIFNFDETGFHDDPKKQRLLFRRQCRSPEIIRNATKSCYTVIFCSNALGEFIPLYVIYKAKQKWSDWLIGAPPGTRMAVTPTGWMDAATFDDWFEHQLLPVLRRKEGKKVVIGDNLSSHITPKCLRLCADNDIRFICLIPNSTHLLQPLDVAYFSALKSDWRKILQAWRNTKRGKIANALPKPVFATLLSKTIEAGKLTAAQNVIAGFRACGFHPLNREVVLVKLKDYSKPLEEVRESIGENFKKIISNIRDNDLQIQQRKKFQIPIESGKSVSVEEVENYYQARDKAKNTKSISGVVKKKGRPAGSKNKTSNKCGKAPTASPVAGPSNLEQSQAFSDLLSGNVSYFPLRIEQEIETETSQMNQETLEYDIEGNYETYEGILEKIEEERPQINSETRFKKSKGVGKKTKTADTEYCVVEYEESFFPGRIISEDRQCVKISIMQKSLEGWKWPSKLNIFNCHPRNIVSRFGGSKITKRGDSYAIDDQFLYMEWGN